MKPPLVVGNWKMHCTPAEALELARGVRRGVKRTGRVEVALAPPFTALAAAQRAIQGSKLRLAAQNAHWESQGAFTGEVSPKMLKAAGCYFVILGHSERRHLFHESDGEVAKKVAAALQAGLRPILCVGETLEERRRGKTTAVIGRQLRVALKGVGKSDIEKLDIAYEPVWAIGTGHNATPDQVSRVHRWIRARLKKSFGKSRGQSSRILYGGSVRPDNARELAGAEEVNGFLVGGASLRAKDFLGIIYSLAK